MRIAFCWPTISGYMAACWRELAERPGVDLYVLALRRTPGKHSYFEPDIMRGVPSHLLDDRDRNSYARIRDLLLAHRPDVVFLSGWQHKAYVPLTIDPDFREVRRFAILDTPRRHDVRQAIGRLGVRAFLSRMEGVFVPGERSWQYARYVGVPERRLHRGTYGVDWSGLSRLYALRADSPGGWPKAFLFTGQYIRRKGVDVLADAYLRYRGRVADPWPLHTAGQGPEGERLAGLPGVTDHGFLQPGDLERLRERVGVFVLPSRADAWPLAVVESCAAGLPVICTEACGSAVELVRPHHNGLLVPTGDVGALADALVLAHHAYDRLPEMGAAARDLASAYSAERWADRILAACSSRVEPAS